VPLVIDATAPQAWPKISSPALMDRPVDSTIPVSATAPNDATTTFVERRVSKVDRRRLSVRSILQGAFSPRRRAGRRDSDRYTPIDWHHPHLMFLSLVMLALSVADAFLTVTLLNSGAEEANPLLALFVTLHPALFAAVKMALTGVSIVLLVAVAQSRLFRVISGRLVFQGLVLAYLALVLYEAWLLRVMG
jgi:hypothetical protein